MADVRIADAQRQTNDAPKLRVAAYCRVSTDKDEQQISFDTQCRVYTDMIQRNQDWEFAGIYADEGITGTNTRHRKAFLRMIQDCEEGKIDLILTKSISRFARNTLDCLQTVRKLQSMGVQVLFEKEHIDTRSAYSEMLLTILAAFAQEESRSLSENLKWGIRSRFKEKKPRWASVYGYTANDEETYLVVPEEAAVIQKIFDLYEHGMGVTEIIRYLESNHIPSPGGSKRWYDTTIYDLFDNEKYVGDLLLQKQYTVDHISHREVKNDGAVPSYYIKDHHTPIVTRKTQRRVHAIRDMRRQNGNGGPGSGNTKSYPFGEMLKCPICGKPLIRRKVSVQNGGMAWCCDTGYHTKAHFVLWDWFIHQAVLQAYQELDEKLVSTLKQSAAKIMLEYKKEHPAFEQVDYYWLDDLVDHIEIGAHSNMPSVIAQNGLVDDRTVKVFWKCGLVSTVFSGTRRDKDDPRYVADLHNAYLERKGMLKTEKEAV